MKEFMEVTLGEDPYLTRSSLKDTSGQICRKKHKNMLKNAIGVRD